MIDWPIEWLTDLLLFDGGIQSLFGVELFAQLWDERSQTHRFLDSTTQLVLYVIQPARRVIDRREARFNQHSRQSFRKRQKGKVPVFAIALLAWVRDQKRFTISEVAADWHELMTPLRTMRPSIARISEQLDPWFAASRHTTAPISHTRPLL